jgi:hypothetical protein
MTTDPNRLPNEPRKYIPKTKGLSMAEIDERVETPKQLAMRVGITEGQVRQLIRRANWNM